MYIYIYIYHIVYIFVRHFMHLLSVLFLVLSGNRLLEAVLSSYHLKISLSMFLKYFFIFS